MKKTFSTIIVIAIVCFTMLAKATVISVNNNGGGQYSNLQTAIDAINAGDTIYVSGSNTNYGTVTLKKRVTIIGTGANPQKQNPLVSSVYNVIFDSLVFVSNASGSVVEGLNITGTIYCNNAHPQNITILRNEFNSCSVGMGSSNWVFANNICASIQINNNSNITIAGNIIEDMVYASNQPTVKITNNLFFYNSSNNAFSQVYNDTITNNIFYGAAPLGCSLCVFYNNLTFNTSQDTVAYGNNSGSGNFIAHDPMFKYIQTLNYQFSPTNNYMLSSSSPGYGTGTDGSDIGPYGGSNYLQGVSPIGLEPAIPQVKTMSINTIVNYNGTINLNVSGTKKDYISPSGVTH